MICSVKFLVLTLSLSFAFSFVMAQRTKRSEYIDNYAELAVKEMKRTGIPASITLAQACLESDDGNSMLAKEANNHFGIKCHSSWTGEKMHKDDDQQNECFRVYKSVQESFRDHSDFLVNGKRYAFLFEYKSTDYKSWAKGLKEAGYATNPKYPDLLIKIIEDNQLYKYDADIKQTDKIKDKDSIKVHRTHNEQVTVTLSGREVRKNNGIKYILAKEGDTFDKLAEEMELLNYEIPKYNELTRDSLLRQGQLLYIQPKKGKAERGKEKHTVKKGETIYSISQLYGIKLSKLRAKNNLSDSDYVHAGDELWLRRKKLPDNR